MDTDDTEMRDGTRTFSYGDGIVIVSRNHSVIKELESNINFIEYQPGPPPPLRVFFSHDLDFLIKSQGLPTSIKKFLYSAVFS